MQFCFCESGVTRMKKVTVLLVLFVFVFTACSAGHTKITDETPSIIIPNLAREGAEASTPNIAEDGRIIITVGTFQTENNAEYELLSYTQLKRAVQHFNSANEEYMVEIRNYGDAKSNDALYQLNSEILSGDMPDMLVTYGMPEKSYAAKGLLFDLYQWYDGEQFFTGPLRSMETDGKLYSVSPALELVSFYGLKSVLGEKNGYSLNEISNIWNDFFTGENSFIRQFNGFYTFLILAGMRIDEWIDAESTCCFNSPEFISLLEFCHKLPTEVVTTQSESYSQGTLSSAQIDALCVKNQDALLGFLFISGEVGSVIGQYADSLTPLNGEQIIYIGIPGTKPGSSGCICELPISVSSHSNNLDGVKLFLDSLWDLRYLEINENDLRSIPLMRSVLENHIQYLKENSSKTLIDETGEAYTAIYFSQNTMPCLDSSITDFLQQIESACVHIPQTFLSEINPIIAEEALLYFSNTQTAEMTAANIQARYNIYLEEQK